MSKVTPTLKASVIWFETHVAPQQVSGAPPWNQRHLPVAQDLGNASASHSITSLLLPSLPLPVFLVSFPNPSSRSLLKFVYNFPACIFFSLQGNRKQARLRPSVQGKIFFPLVLPNALFELKNKLTLCLDQFITVSLQCSKERECLGML